MKRVCPIFAVAMGAGILLGTGACDRSEPVSRRAEGGGRGDGAPQAQVKALEGESLDAVDLLIAQNALRSSFNPISLSPQLQKRLSKYDEQVRFELNIKGVREPFMGKDAKTEIPAGAQFGGKLEGALNAEIQILNGEVGIRSGEIFVSEGTEATVNGLHYRCREGRWVQTAMGPEGATK